MSDTEGKNQSDVEVLQYLDDTGRSVAYERFSRRLAVSAFVYGDRFKTLCAGCPKQGKNLSCPPYSPSFSAHIKGARSAQIICVRLPQEYFSDLPPGDRYHACFREASRVLLLALRDYRRAGYEVAGSGPCLACESCCLERGLEACVNPKDRTFSLESLGVDVIGLLKTSLNLDLEWSSPEGNASTVCAVGAAFFT